MHEEYDIENIYIYIYNNLKIFIVIFFLAQSKRYFILNAYNV